MRLDLFLKRCCILRRRSEAKRACDNGIVSVDGHPAKAGRTVQPGQRIEISFMDRYFAFEIVDLPRGNVAKASAQTYYHVLRDDVREAVDF